MNIMHFYTGRLF